MKYSELAKDIVHILYEAQRNTYFASENVFNINKTDNQIKQWINTKFKKLSEKIGDPINYSIEEIIMSEVTLAFAGEYVGRTYADILSIIPNSKIYDSLIGKPFSSEGYHYIAKYMFEICYNLYCLNTKLSIIHGDLHLNNATIGPLYYPILSEDKNHINDEIMISSVNIKKDINKGIKTIKDPKVVYVIDDANQYVFPNNGYFSCIIDFSRSIINPDNYQIFKDESLPVVYQLVKDEDKFKSNEINMLLNLYIQLFPNKIKQKEELVVLFKNHFDAVFKLLTCIDIYMFSIRLMRMLNQSKFPINKKSIDLVEKINRLAESFIATEMNYLINDNTYAKKILADDYPLLTIMKKCFPEYLDGHVYHTGKHQIGTITDIYIANNELKYSINKYDTFPEVMKYIKYTDPTTGKLIENKDITKKRKDNREEYEQSKLHNLEMVNYIAMRHSQKLV